MVLLGRRKISMNVDLEFVILDGYFSLCIYFLVEFVNMQLV